MNIIIRITQVKKGIKFFLHGDAIKVKNLLIFLGCCLLVFPFSNKYTTVENDKTISASKQTTITLNPYLTTKPTPTPYPFPYGEGKGIFLIIKKGEITLLD
jgi:hypothetical protein